MSLDKIVEVADFITSKAVCAYDSIICGNDEKTKIKRIYDSYIESQRLYCGDDAQAYIRSVNDLKLNLWKAGLPSPFKRDEVVEYLRDHGYEVKNEKVE